MADFVLVHGAFSGSHIWNKVRPLLRRAGHEVFTPCMTGFGARAHLVAPHVGLSTHVQDVARTVIYEDLRDIVLVGYSYGGRVVTGTLEFIADRVAHIVYLDTSFPVDGNAGGHSITSVTPLSSENLLERSQQWLFPSPGAGPNPVFDEADAAWLAARRVPMPPGIFTEPVRLAKPIEEFPFTRAFIKAVGNPRPAERDTFWEAADRAKASPAWRYREIDDNHLMVRNHPEELAQLLLEVL